MAYPRPRRPASPARTGRPAARRPRENPPVACRRTPRHNKYIGATVQLYGGTFKITGCFKMPGSTEVRYRATNVHTGEGTTLTKQAVASLASRAPARVKGRRVSRRPPRPPRRRRNELGQFV